MLKLSLIIPAYNEAEGVQQTVSRLRPVLADLGDTYDLEVIFVDDGSVDTTADQLRAAFANDRFVKVVPHGVNKGLGAAVRTGFEHASGDFIVTTDFDGTYSFDTIPLMIQTLIRDNADIITASPYHPQGDVEGVPRARLLFSFGASTFYRLLVKWHIHTWTALFRVYRRSVIQTVSHETNGFLVNTELMVNALDAGFRVIEYPTVLHQREYGQSSMKVARVTTTHLKYIATLPWRRKPSVKPGSISV